MKAFEIDNYEKRVLSSVSVFGGLNPTQQFANRVIQAPQLQNHFRSTCYAALMLTATRSMDVKLRMYQTIRSTAYVAPGKHLTAMEKKKLEVRCKSLNVGNPDIQEVLEHPFLDFLNHPNELITGRQSAIYGQLYQDVVGIAYYRLIYENDIPIGYYLLPPSATEAIRDEKGNILSYEFGGKSDPMIISADEVIVRNTFNLFNPYGMDYGTSAVRSIMTELGIQEQISSTLVAILSNQGQPTGYLKPSTPGSTIGEDESEAMRRKFQQYMRTGSGNIMVLDEDMDFVKLQYSPTDLASVEILGEMRKVICESLQMPVMILQGIAANGSGSYAAYETSMRAWLDNGISMRLRAYEDFLNLKLLPLWEGKKSGYFMAFDYPSVELEAQNVKMAVESCGGPVLTVNEARSLYLGMHPLDGYDGIREKINTTLQDPDNASEVLEEEIEDEDNYELEADKHKKELTPEQLLIRNKFLTGIKSCSTKPMKFIPSYKNENYFVKTHGLDLDFVQTEIEECERIINPLLLEYQDKDECISAIEKNLI